MNLKLVKKLVTISSLVTLIVGVLVLILALFNVKGIEITLGNNINVATQVMLSSFVICAATFFTGNALNVMHVNKKLSLAAIILIVLSTIGALILFFTKFKAPVAFSKGLAVLAIATVLFVILIGTYLKLQKKFMVLQIALYASVFVLDVILTACIFGAKFFDSDGFLKFFIVFCLVVFVLLCSTNIIGKKAVKEEVLEASEESEYVRIKKSEYEELLAKAKKLEELEK